MSKKILIVDDKPFMMRLIQHHLERAGYELIKARNQKEASAAIQQQSPELVVLNDRAARQKSPEELKPGHAVRAIPVIRMTDIPQTLETLSASSAEVTLTRPFSPTQLVAEVKRLVPEIQQ